MRYEASLLVEIDCDDGKCSGDDVDEAVSGFRLDCDDDDDDDENHDDHSLVISNALLLDFQIALFLRSFVDCFDLSVSLLRCSC